MIYDRITKGMSNLKKNGQQMNTGKVGVTQVTRSLKFAFHVIELEIEVFLSFFSLVG